MRIGEKPLSRNVARLLRLPNCEDIPEELRQSKRGVRIQLREIVKWIKDNRSEKITEKTLENMITGERNTCFANINNFCDAYYNLYNIKIDPNELFIDQNKWITHKDEPIEYAEICNILKNLDSEQLMHIKALAISYKKENESK